MQRYTYPLFMTLMVILLVAMGHRIHTMMEAVPSWDGQYHCNPGSTYTVKECK